MSICIISLKIDLTGFNPLSEPKLTIDQPKFSLKMPTSQNIDWSMVCTTQEYLKESLS